MLRHEIGSDFYKDGPSPRERADLVGPVGTHGVSAALLTGGSAGPYVFGLMTLSWQRSTL